jgi:hypothetical protein
MSPRRMLLLLGGVVAFGVVYAVYARALGWLDGLPQLPPEMLKSPTEQPPPPPRTGSPTIEKLKIAFGPDCKEQDSQNYPTQLEFRNGESSVVLASGTPPFNNGSNRVLLSPFSLAVFGKPRPDHLRPPGEVTEISTFHADKAVLEFDRPINGPNDMNTARLLRMELISDPEFVPADPRNDVIHITNNQRSPDPDRHLVLRTRGPVFYRNPKHVTGPATGPDVWTDAAVEIIDKQNLPRGYSRGAPPTAPGKGEDLRQAAAVGDILTGARLPPPTVTAVGMRIYLEPEKPSTVPDSPAARKGSAGFSGVRRVELLEKVLVNLWVDGSQSLVTDPGDRPEPGKERKKGAEKKPGPLGPADPPAAAAGVIGGLMHAALVARQLEKALLQIETLGPFAYDVERNVARFDVLPQASPSLLNDVQVTRTPAKGGQTRLFSQVLEIEFKGPPTGPQPAAPPGEGAPEPAGPTFKQLHAWTHTPGRYLTVSAEGEQLEAYGYDLVHEQDVNRTTLHGVPLYAVRERNVLTAGNPQKAGALVMQTGPDGRRIATVYGAGRIEMVDAQTGENTITASWQKTLSQMKETVGGVEMDLLVFDEAAMFEDKQADYWLKGDQLKLWLKPGKGDEKDRAAKVEGKESSGSGPLPHRLQAIGRVSSHSTELDIERAEHLNVLFRDVPPPPEPKAEPRAAAPLIPPPMNPVANAPPPAAPALPPPPEPAKPKPPMKLTARVVDTDVVRYPVKKPAGPKDAKPAPKGDGKAAEPSLKYELETARCDGGVVVHQDPDSPEKPRGVDILGASLVINHSPRGSIMHVHGTDEKPGQVHFEGTSIIGPKVVIDQVSNSAEVMGRGSLVMPASSDLNGGELKNPEVVVVHWRDGMEFFGARKKATFTGSVTAVQKESWVKCHLLEVTFDRPVYFNNLKKSGEQPPPRPTQPTKDGRPADPKDDNPKIETVTCTPAPEDAREVGREVWFQEVIRDETGKIVKLQHVTARELYLNARRLDERGEPYQMVMAHGPAGIVRVWQAGQKDMTGPPPQANGQPQPPQPTHGNKDSDTEMKLTVVTFNGRMTVKDRGKVYQEAVFTDNIRVVNVPTDDPNVDVQLRHQLPPRALELTCVDRLTVSTYKKGDNPPEQSMTARGNSYIRSEEYEGWGEVVTYVGYKVTLFADDPERPGNRDSLARIVSRFKGTSESAKTIIYDRMTQAVKTEKSAGGTIQSPPPQPKPPAPQPKQPQTPPGLARPPMR